MPQVRVLGVFIAAVALVTLAQPAAALTLEEAMAQCRAKFAYQGDTEGAPKQHLAIEACARQMVRESRNSGPGQRR
jgi:hypothetical protein